MKVLIADDHPLMVDGLCNLLEAHGIDVVGTVGDGQAAVAEALRLEPDLVLMDIRMPVCDGLCATRLIKAQRPAVLDRGLRLAFEDLVDEARKRANGAPQIKLEIELAEGPDLPEETLTQLYRIAQEALANALKHAEASTIRVLLHGTGSNSLNLAVADDGVGMVKFTQEIISGNGHFGLALMRERAAMIGATLSIQSQSGGGTSVTLELCSES